MPRKTTIQGYPHPIAGTKCYKVLVIERAKKTTETGTISNVHISMLVNKTDVNEFELKIIIPNSS